MGQKVNPNGFRFGIHRNWNSRWFADEKIKTMLLPKRRLINSFNN